MIRDTWIVIPVHNRRETTLRCLRQLRDAGVFKWACVVVVDDGSTDGTAEAIASEFSTAPVTVQPGDGQLWWAGGINAGMKSAYDADAAFVIWLNDDCVPGDDALGILRRYAAGRENTIAVGQAVCPSGSIYGGYRRAWRGLRRIECPASQDAISCDTFAGNAVCFRRRVITQVGYLDATHMPMIYADVDYGLRAREVGFTAVIVGEAPFENEDNLGYHYQSWLLGDYQPLSMWRSFRSPKSPLAFGARFRFFVRHWGAWGYVLAGQAYLRFAVIVLIRWVVPLRVLRALFGSKAKTWQKFKFHQKRM